MDRVNMPSIRRSILHAVCVSLVLLSSATGVVAGPVFLQVRVRNRFFEPGKTAPEIQARTREKVGLDVLVYDLGGRVVAHRASVGADGARLWTDHHAVSLGELPAARDGLLFYALVACDREMQRVAVFPGEPKGFERLVVGKPKLSATGRHIEYVLPKMGFIQFRVGLLDGLCLETIGPAAPQPAGRRRFTWDGTCQNGCFTNLYDHPDLRVVASATALPPNTVVDCGAHESARQAPSGGADLVLPAHLADLRSPPWGDGDGPRAWADKDAGRDARLDVAVAQDGPTETLTVRVNVHPNDRSRLFRSRFEVMVFLDTLFVMEEEHAVLPASFRVPVPGLKEGNHVATVNVMSTDGVIGTASRVFEIRL